MNNKITIESLSMDLLRVALGYHKKSIKMADRFREEALRRCSEIAISQLRPDFVRILNKIPPALSENDIEKRAEDSLMYSTLCKNYARKYLS